MPEFPTSVSSEHYQYRDSLQDHRIRLVQIHPDSSDGSLQCSLIIVSLDSDVHFKAASYVWGDPTDTRPIICNGAVLLVTRNLFAFLQRVRESGETSLIWADAICINQSDDQEKNVQLREGEEHDVAAFDLMRHLCPSVTKPTKEDVRGDLYAWKAFTEELNQYPNILKASLGLSSLWSCPWFSRVWIVQEMVVTDDLTFWKGRNVIGSEIFFRGTMRVARSSRVMAFTLDRIAPRDRIYWRNLLQLYQIRIKLKDTRENFDTHLVDLVKLTRSFQATDPRDKIYALVGLSTDTSLEYIDYRKDLREVLIRHARDALSDTRLPFLTTSPAEFLSFPVATDRNTGPQLLPSWVPAFHDYPLDYTPLADCMFGTRLEDALQGPKFSFEPKDTLSVSGALCDTIKSTFSLKTHWHVGQTYGRMLEDGAADFNSQMPLFVDKLHENLAVVVSLSDERLKVLRSIKSYPTEEDPLDAYWRTLMCNSLRPDPRIGPSDDSKVIPPADFRDKWEAWEEYIRLQLEIYYEKSSLRPSLGSEVAIFLRILSFLLISACIGALIDGSIFSVVFSIVVIAYGSNIAYKPLDYLVRKLLQFFSKETLSLRFIQRRNTARPFETRLEYTSGRKFCITENGYMGLVPECARAGDRLLVVKGSRVLFVVCPYHEECKLMGDTYIHGLMNGVANGLPNMRFQNIMLL